jgi:hemolysin-activating ACP:hemolysin acyltransferase
MSLEEAKGEKVDNKIIKDYVYEVDIDENYEKTLLEIYKKAKQTSGENRLILKLNTPFGFSLEIKTSIITGELE